MSKRRLKLTNEDLKDLFKFKDYLNLPEKQFYCHIYGRTYTTKDDRWLFDNKEEIIESFMTSDVFKPLWDKLTEIVLNKYQYLFLEKGLNLKEPNWWAKSGYLDIHNKLEDCINYYKEVVINRMIRMRAIVFYSYK